MNLNQKFNSLNGLTVSRKTLEKLLAQAEKEKNTMISKRVIKVLKANSDNSFIIEIKNLVEPYGLNAPIKRKITSVKKKVATKMQPKRTIKVVPVVKKIEKQTTQQNKSISDLEKLGFISASKVPETPKDVFRLNGDLGKFIQDIQPHKALILIKGTKHTSKSQLAMQIANGFGEIGKPVAYIDYEQGGMDSKDTIDSLNRNTTAKGRELIAVKGFLEKPLEELKEYCKHCQVIVADSVTDLGISADQLNDLRVGFPKVIWVFISQVKENGQMYGGNKMAHNPTAIIECHPSENPKERYATLIKNRGNDLSIKYSMYYKKLVTKAKKEVEKQGLKISATNVATKNHTFSFNVN